MKKNISSLVLALLVGTVISTSARGEAFLCARGSTEYATCLPNSGASEITTKYKAIKICQKPGKVWMVVQHVGGGVSPLLPSTIGTDYLGVNTGPAILPGVKIQFLENRVPGDINAYFWVRTHRNTHSAKGICYQHGLQTYPNIE